MAQRLKTDLPKQVKYFSSFAAVKIGKKSVHHHLLTNDGAHFFLPIFTAGKDEKYFTKQNIFIFPKNFLDIFYKAGPWR